MSQKGVIDDVGATGVDMLTPRRLSEMGHLGTRGRHARFKIFLRLAGSVIKVAERGDRVLRRGRAQLVWAQFRHTPPAADVHSATVADLGPKLAYYCSRRL